MLEEQVIVTAVDGATAWVEASPATSCAGCSQVCASSALQKHLGRKRAPLQVQSSLPLAAGDQIIIGIDERALLWGALLVYVLPLLGLLAGAVAAQTLWSAFRGPEDWPALVGGAVGLFVSLAIARRFPRLGVAALQPVVLRKVLR